MLFGYQAADAVTTPVVVIGGTSGIGFAVALLARELGAALVVASSKAAKVDAAVERLPGATGDVVDLKDGASSLSNSKSA